MLHRGALAFLFALSASAARAQDLAGYVAELEGSSVTLLRGGAPARRLRLGENVLVGDTVVVTPPARARIDTVAGPVILCLTPPSSGECRQRFLSEGGLRRPAAIADRFWKMLSWYSPPSTDLSTRNADPPAFGIGGRVPQRLVAGERRIWIAWDEGNPPFEIVLQAGKIVLASARTSERSVLLPSASLREGSAGITLKDSRGRVATLPLTIANAPPKREDLTSQTVNSEHRVLLQAADLTTIDDGVWTLEAIQRIEPLTSNSQLAVRMRHQLAAGRSM